MMRAARIRAYLEARRVELNEEVRHYPTPIARCDQHLTALLEARDEVSTLLRLREDAALVEAFTAVAAGWGDADAGQFDEHA